MNKNIIIGSIIAVIIVIAGIVGFTIYKNNPEESKQNETNSDEQIATERENNNENTEDGIKKDNGKVLVVYYSAQNHTKEVAEKIANNLEADIFEIIPKQIYTSEDLDWTNDNSRVSREHDDENLRNIELTNTKIDNWESYDTILIGYPIWWGIAAWPVDNFVKENDFSGKTVIPFCTSSSSGLGQSGKLLEQEANAGNWLEGHRFNSNASESSIKEWIDSQFRKIN